MKQLKDKNRKYKRFIYTVEETMYLAEEGLTVVNSSNVSAVGISGDDLILRFVNGSLYQYKDQAKRYFDIFASLSKGKWVWANLRRTDIPYKKIGTMPLRNDLKVSDEEIIAIGDRLMGLDDLPGLKEILSVEAIKQFSMAKAIGFVGVEELLNKLVTMR